MSRYLRYLAAVLLHPYAYGAPERYEGRARLMAAIKFGNFNTYWRGQ